jgi:3-isopropylmalate/(R)-2-methylmalate dehydratase large subunit
VTLAWPEPPRVLYLGAELALVRRQLAGEQLSLEECTPLADNVSTDEMAPAWACYFYDERLGDYCLCGLRGGVVEPGAVRRGGFGVLVGGHGFGCGSSRETAPYAQQTAGIRLVIARSFERIYRQNCHNLGLFTSTDLGLLERLRNGGAVAEDELVASLDAVSRSVVLAGGLAPLARARRAGQSSAPRASARPRPQNMVEKILARHWSGAEPPLEAATVAPGDAGFVRADVRFSHDYVTAMIDAQFRAAFGEDARIFAPHSVFLFRDHLSLLGRVMPEKERRLGLLDAADTLAETQRRFAARHGIRLFDEVAPGASEGICHNLVLEHLARPGEVIVGTDSHTCTAGVVGALAFGVGSTDMVAGFLGGDFRISVPESVRIEFRGRLREGTAAKDAWLTLLAREDVAGGLLRGRVLELAGDGFFSLPVEERATLTNMAAEAGAFTAIAEVDERLIATLASGRGVDPAELRRGVVRPDPDARYAARLELDLAAVEPTIALPGDPKNGVPLRQFLAERPPVAIDIAYGGSCTGGKRSDMDMYAAVLLPALREGRRVASGVELFIQFGSQSIRRYAEERGYVALFRGVGASLLEPSCGACIRAGPGVSTRAEQVTVSAINRNFPGRSGPGSVYLASPFVVAASALAGRLSLPRALDFGADARGAVAELA